MHYHAWLGSCTFGFFSNRFVSLCWQPFSFPIMPWRISWTTLTTVKTVNDHEIVNDTDIVEFEITTLTVHFLFISHFKQKYAYFFLRKKVEVFFTKKKVHARTFVVNYKPFGHFTAHVNLLIDVLFTKCFVRYKKIVHAW